MTTGIIKKYNKNMRKAYSLLFAIFLVLLFLPSRANAQETISLPTASGNNYPIANTATTVVGEGGIAEEEVDTDDNPDLPPPPTLDEFLKYFEVYSCTSYSLSIVSDCKKTDKNSRETRFAYGKYSDPMRSERYRQLLNIGRFGKVKLFLKPPEDPNDRFCDFSGGGAFNGTDIRLSGYMDSLCDQDDIKWSMIHESGHIIQDRTSPLFNAFRVETLARADGGDCYDNGVDGSYIQTYRYRGSRNIPDIRCIFLNGQKCDGGGPQAESFGEAVGMNVVCSPNKTCQKAFIPITNYPSKCKNTYDWVKKNVYGGIDFFKPGSGGSSDVVNYAQKITNGLTKLSDCNLYNVQKNSICNKNNYCAKILAGDCSGFNSPAYLCTQLVVDSYNLAGNKNTFSLNTYEMQRAWEKRSGYKVLKTNDMTSTSLLKKGDVVFMFDTYASDGLKHVIVIKDVDIDSNGNGKITILQSNSYSTESYYPVHRWKIIHYYRDNPNAILMFGLGPRT